jgi:glycosyltransferase involved in cell wall biosynthesis
VTLLYFADTRFPIERANGVQTMETCHALARRGHDVTLVVRPDDAQPARDPLTFYDLPALQTLRVRAVPAAGRGAARRAHFLLNATRIALASPRSMVLTRDLGLAAWLLQWPEARRPRVVYESHGLADVVAAEMPALLGKPALAPSASKVARLARREARVWARAAAYVTLTRALADDLAARFGPRDRVFVIPDAARPASVADTDTPPGRFVAAYAGHLYPWKGVDVFVRALAAAPDVDGLIVGGHPGESDVVRVRGLIGALGLGDRVRVTGLVPPRAVGLALAEASVLVLPNTDSAISARYTSPLKLFEYLWMQRAIVASDLPALREVLTDGVSARLVPPGDARALASALVRLREHPAEAAALATAARALAPRYTWDARAERMEAALEAAAL